VSQVIFVGTGEAFDPALPNTSLLYRGGRTVLFDCGYSVPHALWRISSDPDLLDAIYVSHIHADHTFGLPALLLWMRVTGRTRPLEVFGGAGVGHWLDKLLNVGYPGSYARDKCFAIEPMELTPGRTLEYGGLTLDTAESAHPVRNLSVRVGEAGRSFCYSGDGAPTAATRALYEGTDLLVHECYWLVGNDHGHACIEELIPLAELGRVRHLALLHLGRDLKAAIAARAEVLAGAVPVSIPAPGDVVVL
jgi:ribonuclease BN (tRNA processing enzyme)